MFQSGEVLLGATWVLERIQLSPSVRFAAHKHIPSLHRIIHDLADTLLPVPEISTAPDRWDAADRRVRRSINAALNESSDGKAAQ